MKYDLIVFDMDGTLYTFEGSGVDDAFFQTKFYDEIAQRGMEFIAKKLSISINEAEKMRKHIFDKYKGEVSLGLQKEYGIKREDYFNYSWNIKPLKYINQNPLLRKNLSEISVKKAVLTAAPPVWANNALVYLNIQDLFDTIWTDDGKQIRKEDTEAYKKIALSLKVDSSRAIMVEDQPRCLKQAKEVGMTTVLIGSEKQDFIDYNLNSIYGIADLVNSLNA